MYLLQQLIAAVVRCHSLSYIIAKLQPIRLELCLVLKQVFIILSERRFTLRCMQSLELFKSHFIWRLPELMRISIQLLTLSLCRRLLLSYLGLLQLINIRVIGQGHLLRLSALLRAFCVRLWYINLFDLSICDSSCYLRALFLILSYELLLLRSKLLAI